MKNIVTLLMALLLLNSCKKDKPTHLPTAPTHPTMIYTDLQNAEVKYQHSKSVDLDNDGAADLSFLVLLVGDPILQIDRWQFCANSKVQRNLLNNEADQSPMLNKLEIISKNHPGYTWYQVSAIVLAEKIIGHNGSRWDGLWKHASHQYLPVQFEKDGKFYHGWVELSMDTAGEKLVLHKAGLSTEAEREVKAGY